MQAPQCAFGHRPVFCQRWRKQPYAVVDGVMHRRYICPVCRRITFIADTPRPHRPKSPMIHRNPWWRPF